MKNRIMKLFLLFSLLFSCNQNDPRQEIDKVKLKIQEAKKILNNIKNVMPYDPSIKIMERILDQPDFTGPLREWGCIVFFDRDNNIDRAYTIKLKDFLTGHSYKIRRYSDNELSVARSQIIKYKNNMGITKSYPIPILSESIKIAVAESILNEDPAFKYIIGRGHGETSIQLQLIKVEGPKKVVVASEALYATNSEMP